MYVATSKVANKIGATKILTVDGTRNELEKVIR
jgi:hypothetical protein